MLMEYYCKANHIPKSICIKLDNFIKNKEYSKGSEYIKSLDPNNINIDKLLKCFLSYEHSC